MNKLPGLDDCKCSVTWSDHLSQNVGGPRKCGVFVCVRGKREEGWEVVDS